MDYKATLALPKTDFPITASPNREPKYLERWEKASLYSQILAAGKKRPRFLLHDGPPYANGNIHLGHVMNKLLKDIVVKSKTMSGFSSPYVPGWDCHGLPIEYQVLKSLGAEGKKLSPLELRAHCRTYADKYVGIQREEFKRLGIFGDWANPYKTMDFTYQAQIAREFGKVVAAGYVYRSRKAVHWCIYCRTALAEAEIEYENHRSPSIYVRYPVEKGWEEANLPPTPAGQRYAVIWTTTPWTLPASMAIAYHADEPYVVVEKEGEAGRYIVAKALVGPMSVALGLEGKLEEVAAIGKGAKLAGLVAKHPFLERKIPFLPAEHVTMESGTGLVHTAPGHGEEDFELGKKHGLDIYSPVEADGRFEKDVEYFAGLRVFEANPKIIEHLKQVGNLFGPAKEITHSYPHCWRCKNPVIFRATAQWFLSLSHKELREKALHAIDGVKWIPAWGRDRIHGMIENRPDWCLSRQRTWGVPVIAFACKGCGEFLLSPEVIAKVADRFEKEGADAWFARPAGELLPAGSHCGKCDGTEFEKGNDILDVWFDSGASHAAVLEGKRDLGWPCDLYLEGSDQHRGWFHSTLLEALATRGKAPYRAVLTHGFVVDGDGKKMSKSLGNVIAPQEIIDKHGSEPLRLWVATEDYRDDVRLSRLILDHVVESYRRIRNTARYCVSNLSDFNPVRNGVPSDHLARGIDRWALSELATLVDRCRKAYEDYEFHVVVKAINDFCVVDLSSLYLDISKDTLYCDALSGERRRSAQTVLFEIAKDMALLLAPLLPITAEEIWDFLPTWAGKPASVHLGVFPESPQKADSTTLEKWNQFFAVRAEVSKVLEGLRKEKKIGQSLEAEVEFVPGKADALLRKFEGELARLWIVSRVKQVSRLSDADFSVDVPQFPGFRVAARPIQGSRCVRCWVYAEDLGKDKTHPELCGRCAAVVGKA